MLSAPPDPNWGMPAATATVSGYYQPADAAGMMYSQQAPQAINMHGQPMYQQAAYTQQAAYLPQFQSGMQAPAHNPPSHTHGPARTHTLDPRSHLSRGRGTRCRTSRRCPASTWRT